MKIPTLPFTLTDWDEVPEERYNGETGYALWRTLQIEDVRVRKVEYSPGYLADHTGATAAISCSSTKAYSTPN